MNGKAIVLATALVVGVSSVGLESFEAQAASKQVVKKGKLVNSKTGKVIKGFAVYKNNLYKDGKLHTAKTNQVVSTASGLKLFYQSKLKKGQKVVSYNKKSYLFTNGVLKKGIQKSGKNYYENGQRVQSVAEALAALQKLDPTKATSKMLVIASYNLVTAVRVEGKSAATQAKFDYYLKALDVASEYSKIGSTKKKSYFIKNYRVNLEQAFVRLAASKGALAYKAEGDQLVAIINDKKAASFNYMELILIINNKELPELKSTMQIAASLSTRVVNSEYFKTVNEIQKHIQKEIDFEQVVNSVSEKIKFKENIKKTPEENLKQLVEVVKKAKMKLPKGYSLNVYVGRGRAAVEEKTIDTTGFFYGVDVINKKDNLQMGIGLGEVHTKIADEDTLLNTIYKDVVVGK